MGPPILPSNRTDAEWLPVQILTVASGPPVSYTFVEVYIDPAGARQQLAAGRQNTTSDPAYPIDGSTFAVDDIAFARRGPKLVGWELVGTGGSGGSGGTGACKNCGWLRDRVALTDKAFAVTVPAAVGRCACVPTDQGDDPEGIRFLLIYNPATDVWEGTKELTTCCGCGSMTLDIDDSDDTQPTDHVPVLSVTINATCRAAEPGHPEIEPFTARLPLECCPAPGKAVFAGWGLDSCDDPAACENVYYVLLECTGCGVPAPACGMCDEGHGPFVWAFTASGFTDEYIEYNGDWRLQPDEGDPCSWSFACDAERVSATATLTIDCGTITLTFTGGGATAVYTFTSTPPAGIPCFAGQTLARDTGDSLKTPATIDIGQVSCVVGCAISELSVTGSTSICGIDLSSPLALGNGGGTLPFWRYSAGGGTTGDPCDDGGSQRNTCKGFGVIVRCLTDGTYEVGPYCGPTGCDDAYSCYAGPPTTIVAANTDPDPGEIAFSVEFDLDDPACDESPVHVVLTFTGTYP